jgi:hypothetical protein
MNSEYYKLSSGFNFVYVSIVGNLTCVLWISLINREAESFSRIYIIYIYKRTVRSENIVLFYASFFLLANLHST